jgi:hypothetical protein
VLNHRNVHGAEIETSACPAATRRTRASAMQIYSPRRFLRGRPDSAMSYSQLGSRRSSLATTPICQGMTR